MTRMFFNSDGCLGATSEKTGISYNAKNGFIDVHPTDVQSMKDGGYVVAGSVRVRTGKHWVCDNCAWDANINSCGKCGSTNLRKVEA